ncbi:TatD family hydrolase [Candidatus Saccharibacteria bacterium]|nr:TatD family hydrolase [Candidatus Saccharibacteria bacterium]
MEFVDTHSHLQFESFDRNRDAVYEAASAAGVKRIICVGTSLADSQKAITYANAKDGVWAAVGVHPHEAADFLNDPNSKTKLSQLLEAKKVAAVGEIGLDYYKSRTPKDVQEKAFRTQLEIGLLTGLPFSFHARDAWGDFWRILDDYGQLRGVLHSFSSGVKQLDAALERGLHIGLNGIMTFTKDHAQLDAARQVPLERLVLETDAPFLAPAAVRGQVCEPKHTAITAEFLAKLRNQPLEQVAKTTTDNAVKLFKI